MRLSIITPLRLGDPPPIIEPCNSSYEHLVIAEGTARQAVNLGIEKAIGDVLAFVASDDTLSGIDLAMTALFSNPSVDIVYGNTLIESDGSRHVYINPIPRDLRRHLQFRCCATSGFFFRKSLFYSMSWFDESCKSAADYDFLIRLVKARFRFEKIDAMTYTWRKKRDSASTVGRADSSLVRRKHVDFVKPLLSIDGIAYYSKRVLKGQLKPKLRFGGH